MISQEKITQAILACDVSPAAREFAAPLVDAYLEQMDAWPDTRDRTLAVELPWRLQLADNAWIVGVMDRIALDSRNGIYGCEWKTHKAPRYKKNGDVYAGDTEDDWLAEISYGTQLAIYALALREAEFIGAPLKLHVTEPRILVRAAVKSAPPQFWPSDPAKGLFTFSGEYIDTVKTALISRVVQIRAAKNEWDGRLKSMTPWQLPGLHCTNKYRKDCEHLLMCRERRNPTDNAARHVFDMSDPGAKALAGLALNEDSIVLSASSYAASSQCLEKYRLLVGGFFEKQPTVEMEIGTVFHAAVAAIYSSMIEEIA